MNLTRDCDGSVGLGDSFAARAQNASQPSLLRTSFASQVSSHNLNWVGYDSAGLMSNDEGRALDLDLSANPTDLDCLYESGNNFRKNDSTYHCGQSSLTNHSSEISSQDSPNCRGEANTMPGFRSSAANGTQGLNVTSLALEKIKDRRRKAWPPEAAGNELALIPVCPEVHINSGMGVDSNVWYGKDSNPDKTIIRNAVMTGINGVELRNTSLTLSSTSGFIEMGMANNVNMLEHSSSSLAMSGKGIQEVTGISGAPHNLGPFGPFTGYASILKSSKFMKPAQLLLHEMCGIPDSFMIQTSSVLERCPEEVGFGGDLGTGSLNSYSSGSLRPEYQQLKAKLLHMQMEVCKRYRQYHQQMHMVFSSFQNVAGLRSATPFFSLAFETILRNFDFLKNAILYQLRHLKKCFGEELSFPSFGPGTNKGNPRLSKFQCVNQKVPKHKYSAVGEERFHSRRLLRTQRGLPENAVAILRAWLFEHFLHPYPTDTDKHVLAGKTGLSRNQVSNWFINARVRIWKPMVEEIHILDTKHHTDPTQILTGDGRSTAQAVNTSCMDFYQGPDILSRRLTTQVIEAGLISNTDWNQVIRQGDVSISTQHLSPNAGSLLELTQAPHGEVDFRELGSASLALGLPRTAEFGQYQR